MGKYFLYIILIALSVIFVFPLFWLLSGSLKNFAEFFAYPPVLFPKNPKFLNFTKIFSLFPFHRYILNTMVMSGVITILQLLTSSTAGFSFATMDFKGKNLIFIIFLTGMMVPFTVILIPLFYIIRTLNLIDTPLALVLPFVFTSYGIFLMRQFFMGVPKDLYDAAVIDGSSPFRIYHTIYLPLSTPVIATLGIQAFVFFYNNLLWPLIIINSEEKKTISIGLLSLISRETSYPHLVMAGAVICIFPSLVLFIVLQKYFVKGIIMTGIKG